VLATTITAIEPVRNRIFKTDYGTGYVRVPLAKVAINIIRNHPFNGIGLGDYTHKAKMYDVSGENVSYWFPMPVHNEFLLIAAEIGIPSLLLFIFIMIVIFYKIKQIINSSFDDFIPFISIGILGGLISWFIHQQFNYHYALVGYMSLPIGIILAMHKMIEDNLKKNVSSIP
jgi:O-antigen ligase